MSVGMEGLTLCLLVSSTDCLCRQFGPRSGPSKRRLRSGSKQFDTFDGISERFNFENVNF